MENLPPDIHQLGQLDRWYWLVVRLIPKTNTMLYRHYDTLLDKLLGIIKLEKLKLVLQNMISCSPLLFGPHLENLAS